MEYITVNEAAEKWGVSGRSITYHLVAGRIPGALKKGNMWLIPRNASKPDDRRKRRNKEGE
ncbi:transcriptional regulator, AraC family [Syntrophobotulus glycolicus DSM 8271]|uniref:Transcriptional regulator, AraC family n=1 Tax=Syntrophobotulus glycolicus (strain DSM 8271 / FlGlyR) TaxID=645991 RepID=F0SUP1_SYNGF|nr:helix-turn-helix domain-containing protein [Syntrophobotulus glycolicus]ADY55534.1 transcriptional regulator, AraC family [Syntrophobotulus glycolicus DSM 8271]